MGIQRSCVKTGWRRRAGIESPIQVADAGHCCVKGNYRAANEDRCLVRREEGIYLIADGIGGQPGGAAASRIALDAVADCLSAHLSAEQAVATSVEAALVDGIDAARAIMMRHALVHPECDCMGTTLSGCVVKNNNAYFFRVGDCRVYLSRNGKVRCQTKDETYVQLLIDLGVISKKAARSSSLRHYVLNQIGIRGTETTPSVQTLSLRCADRLILSTDGLSGVLDEGQIAAVSSLYPDSQDCADKLVDEAIQQDSHDNVSCIVIDCTSRT